MTKNKVKIKEKIINFFKWIWNECKDWHTVVLLLCVIVVMYSPVWGGYILYAVFKWEWCAAVASGYMLLWAGPFTPFFPLCVGITLSIKKLISCRRKPKEKIKEIANRDELSSKKEAESDKDKTA